MRPYLVIWLMVCEQPSPFPSVSAPKLCLELHNEQVQSIRVGGRGANFFLLPCDVEVMASRALGYVDLRLCLGLWWSMYSPFALTVRARSSAVRIVMESSGHSFLCCLIFLSLWQYYGHLYKAVWTFQTQLFCFSLFPLLSSGSFLADISWCHL